MAHDMWEKRQQGNGAFGDEDDEYDHEYDGYDSWWWSPAGMAVRYAIVAILFGGILLFFIGGYYSTQRRLRRGLPPRPAFRWMARRRQAYDQQQHPRTYRQPSQPYPYRSDPNGQGYGMEGYPAPPPPYSNGEMPPPVYQPPQGASKALPDQNVQGFGRGGEGSSSAGVGQPAPAAMRP